MNFYVENLKKDSSVEKIFLRSYLHWRSIEGILCTVYLSKIFCEEMMVRLFFIEDLSRVLRFYKTSVRSFVFRESAKSFFWHELFWSTVYKKRRRLLTFILCIEKSNTIILKIEGVYNVLSIWNTYRRLYLNRRFLRDIFHIKPIGKYFLYKKLRISSNFFSVLKTFRRSYV